METLVTRYFFKPKVCLDELQLCLPTRRAQPQAPQMLPASQTMSGTIPLGCQKSLSTSRHHSPLFPAAHFCSVILHISTVRAQPSQGPRQLVWLLLCSPHCRKHACANPTTSLQPHKQPGQHVAHSDRPMSSEGSSLPTIVFLRNYVIKPTELE